jgi:hypothetical protein
MVGKHSISIWFFIGSLLAVYGVLILGAGIYELFSPAATAGVTLSQLHLPIWWGIGMLVLGSVYVKRFWPNHR